MRYDEVEAREKVGKYEAQGASSSKAVVRTAFYYRKCWQPSLKEGHFYRVMPEDIKKVLTMQDKNPTKRSRYCGKEDI